MSNDSRDDDLDPPLDPEPVPPGYYERIGQLLRGDPQAPGPPVVIDYTNWRGERGLRRVRPLRLWHGATEHHREPQWLLDAWDEDKGADRTFALAGVHAFGTAAAAATRGRDVAAQAVVRALAASRPTDVDGTTTRPVCAFCGLYLDARVAAPWEPASHEPGCTWRAAAEWAAANPTGGDGG